MGRENDAMLEYLRDNRRFADLFNVGFFAGECVVDPEKLEEAGENYTELREGDGTSVTRSRDIKKRLNSGTELRILAVEDQSSVDYTMPWRCMNYDSLEYGRQVRELRAQNKEAGHYEDEGEWLCQFRKTDRLAPVYTVCLYHGAGHWDGPRSLKEMMQFGSDEEKKFWEKRFSDYRMNLICVNELEDVTRFTTELREVFAIMAYRKDKRGMDQFLAEHEEYQHLDEETARTIGTVMGVESFMADRERYRAKGEYNMCQAIREMWEDGINQGISQGIEVNTLQSIRNLTETVNFSVTQAMDALRVPEKDREKYIKQLEQ